MAEAFTNRPQINLFSSLIVLKISNSYVVLLIIWQKWLCLIGWSNETHEGSRFKVMRQYGEESWTFPVNAAKDQSHCRNICKNYDEYRFWLCMLVSVKRIAKTPNLQRFHKTANTWTVLFLSLKQLPQSQRVNKQHASEGNPKTII